MAIAEKIRQSLSEVYRLSRTYNRNGNGNGSTGPSIEHHCTASLGVAVFDPNQTDQEIILHQADEAKYKAKEAGRNRVVLHNGALQTAT